MNDEEIHILGEVFVKWTTIANQKIKLNWKKKTSSMKLVIFSQLLLGAALATLVESSCKARRRFYPSHSKTYHGPMLYKYTKATQTAEQCQRMCNQVLKCTGFVLRWAGPQRGYCDFFEATARDPAVDLVDSAETTVYLVESEYKQGPVFIIWCFNKYIGWNWNNCLQFGTPIWCILYGSFICAHAIFISREYALSLNYFIYCV